MITTITSELNIFYNQIINFKKLYFIMSFTEDGESSIIWKLSEMFDELRQKLNDYQKILTAGNIHKMFYIQFKDDVLEFKLVEFDESLITMKVKEYNRLTEELLKGKLESDYYNNPIVKEAMNGMPVGIYVPKIIVEDKLPDYFNWLKNAQESLREIINHEDLIYSIKKKSDNRKKNLSAPAIGVFAYLLNENKIFLRGESESIDKYCKRVCDKFKLPFTGRIRQHYTGRPTTKHCNEISKEILPRLNNELQDQIAPLISIKIKRL